MHQTNLRVVKRLKKYFTQSKGSFTHYYFLDLEKIINIEY